MHLVATGRGGLAGAASARTHLGLASASRAHLGWVEVAQLAAAGAKLARVPLTAA